MNPAQTLGATRAILAFVAGIAATVGLLKPDQVAPLVDAILAAVGPVTALATLVWSIWAHSHDNARKDAVAAVKADPSVEGNIHLITALTDAGADIRITPAMPETKAEAELPVLGIR